LKWGLDMGTKQMIALRPNEKRNKRKLNISRAAERELKKMGYAGVLKDLRRVLEGTYSSENSRATVQLCNDLHEAFRHADPKLDGPVVGSVVVRLTEVVERARSLSQRLNEVKDIRARATRKELRYRLALIYEVELSALRRNIAGLQREIPRLIEALGGDPSEELILPRKRVMRGR
jgi:hypothetical protein